MEISKVYVASLAKKYYGIRGNLVKLPGEVDLSEKEFPLQIPALIPARNGMDFNFDFLFANNFSFEG